MEQNDYIPGRWGDPLLVFSLQKACVFFEALRLLSVPLYWLFILLSASFPSDWICLVPLVSDVCLELLLPAFSWAARAAATDAVDWGRSALISISSFSRWAAAWVGRHGLLKYTSYAE